MKKILLGFVLLSSLFSYGQLNYPRFGLGVNYSITGSVGVDFLVKPKDAVIVGVGISIPLEEDNLIGDNYSGSEYSYVNKYSDQIILDEVMNKDCSVYLIGGKEVKHFRFAGKLGIGTKYNFINYKDPSKAFGYNGYYYRKGDLEVVNVLVGASVSVILNDYASLDLGFDTFNHGTLGVSFLF